jgi:vanillate O-demethylase monooxygenase subunit
MTYLRNTWYAAGWSRELAAGQLLARTFLDEPVVLFRDASGAPKALADRCPHRFAPLSMGRLRDSGAALECGYHGLRFNGEGACIFNPHGDGRIPKAATVRSYPVAERYSALWIWMGDPAQADPNRIPEFGFLDETAWAVGTGHMAVDGHYELENDNILDLSHIEFMHPLFASEAVRRGLLECTQEGETVWSRRFISDDRTLPDFLYEAFHIEKGKPVDRWLDVRWNAPALMALWTGGVASGRPREEGVVTPTAHFFTPESSSRTHYFFAISFPRVMGPVAEEMAREGANVLRGPFEHEDKPMIEAVARRMGGAELWSLKPVLLSGDAAAVRARRQLQALIAKEAADSMPGTQA